MDSVSDFDSEGPGSTPGIFTINTKLTTRLFLVGV
jgi:hypothetical protein